MKYSEKLKDPKWQKRRLEILSRDDFRCLECGRNDLTLHVHHRMYFDNPWDAPDWALETKCEECHIPGPDSIPKSEIAKRKLIRKQLAQIEADGY